MSSDFSLSTLVPEGGMPVFLGVKPGDIVVVWDDPRLMETDSTAWWMGEVLFSEGSARDPKMPSLFQVGDVDTGEVQWVNGDCVQKVVMPASYRER